MRILLTIAVALLMIGNLSAQEAQQVIDKVTVGKSIFSNVNVRDFSRKGEWFIHHGWNFSWYDTSNLNLKGPGYDFTLKNITLKTVSLNFR